jgi:hypothetical protein
MSIERHEASHAACAIWLRRRVAYVERYFGSFLPGEAKGFCMAPIDGDIEGTQVVLALVGYLSENREGWPPPYDLACHERREALGKLIDILDITPEQYEAYIDATRDMLANEDFIRLRDAIERALYSVPRLDAIAVLDLAKATGIPVSSNQGATPA